MARIRTIKPEFPQSESMGRISRDARLTFLMLLTIVDDVGRTRAASRMLASILFPYDDDAPGLIDGWLAELVGEHCITLYEVDGTHYLQIINWKKHQKIDHPSPSKLPGPSDMFAKPREDFADARASRARGLDLGSGSKDLGPRTREGSTREPARENAPPPREGKPDDWPEDYQEQFAQAFPKKERMAGAFRILDGIRRDGNVSWRVMIDAVTSYAAKTDDAYWASPTGWLQEERWNDRPSKPAGNGAHRPSPGDRARELARAVEARERADEAGGAAAAVGGAELGGDDARLVSGRERA